MKCIKSKNIYKLITLLILAFAISAASFTTFAAQTVTPTYSLLEQAPSLAIRNFWKKLIFEHDIESAVSQVELAGIRKPLFIGLEPKNPMESMEEWNRYGEWGVPQVGFYLEKIADSEYEVRVPSLFQRETDGESGFQFRFRRSGPVVAATEPSPQFRGVWGQVLLGQIIGQLMERNVIHDSIGWTMSQYFLDPSGRRAWLLLENSVLPSVAVTVSMTPTIEVTDALALGVVTENIEFGANVSSERAHGALMSLTAEVPSGRTVSHFLKLLLLKPFTSEPPLSLTLTGINSLRPWHEARSLWSRSGSIALIYNHPYSEEVIGALLNVKENARVGPLLGNEGRIEWAGFSSDETRILTVHEVVNRVESGGHINHLIDLGYMELKVWDTATGELVSSKIVPSTDITKLPKDSLYSRLVEGHEGPTPVEEKDASVQQISTLVNFYSVSISGDGKKIAVFNNDVVSIWDLDAHRLVGRVELGPTNELEFSLSHDGSLLVTAKIDQDSLELWDVRSGKLLRRFFYRGTFIRSFGFSPDQQKLAVLSDQTLQVFNLVEQDMWETEYDSGPHMGKFVFSADSKKIVVTEFIVTGFISKNVEFSSGFLWWFERNQKIDIPNQVINGAKHVTFINDGSEMAFVGTGRNSVQFWNPQSGPTSDLKVSPQDRYHAVVESGVVKIYDLLKLKSIATVHAFSSPSEIVLSQNGHQLSLVVTSYNSATVWTANLIENKDPVFQLQRVYGDPHSYRETHPVHDLPAARSAQCEKALSLYLHFDHMIPLRK